MTDEEWATATTRGIFPDAPLSPEEAGRRDYKENRPWAPPTQEEPGYREYSRGWARGRAEQCTRGHAHEEYEVTYPSSGYFYAWDSDEAASVIKYAGGGVYRKTGRTLNLDEAIAQMNKDLNRIRKNLPEA